MTKLTKAQREVLHNIGRGWLYQKWYGLDATYKGWVARESISNRTVKSLVDMTLITETERDLYQLLAITDAGRTALEA